MFHNVSLKIRSQARVADPAAPPTPAPPGADIFGRAADGPMADVGVELLIDGKPLAGLLQKLVLEFDANARVPVLTVSFVPVPLAADVALRTVDVRLTELTPERIDQLKRAYTDAGAGG